MEEKKKRGSNYTVSEKIMLLELVQKHPVIENKETNARMILKKRNAWNSVSQRYNAVAVSGTRSWQQLRHLYENMKQRSKKNIAKANRPQFYNDINDARNKASIDKKEINRTDDGVFKSVLKDQYAQISPAHTVMVASQVQLLSNQCDDSAFHSGDVKKLKEENQDRREIEVQVEISPEVITNIINSDEIDEKYETNANNTSMVKISSKTVSPYVSENQEATTATNTKVCDKPQTSATALNGVTRPKLSSMRDQYFKTKLKNAKLETKYLINKNRMELNKYKLEMEILKLKLQKLRFLRKR